MTSWLWIPIVIAAAGFQTVRNAAQRSLVSSAGTLPATLVRFIYGLPFAIGGLLAIATLTADPLPTPTSGFLAWVSVAPVHSSPRRHFSSRRWNNAVSSLP